MKPRKKSITLLGMGAQLGVMGLAFLLLPAFAPSTRVMAAIGSGLRMPGWLALALGALLMVLHVAAARRNGSKPARDARAPSSGRAPAAHVRARDPAVEAVDSGTAAGIPRTADRKALAVTPDANHKPIAAPTRPARWSSEVFTEIEWRRFEAFCEALFKQAGFRTGAQSHGPDGGVDIWLYSGLDPNPVAIVQCKHWQQKPVPIGVVREFLGAMTAHEMPRGTLATSSTFTNDAREFARANRINAQDGAGLLALIARRTPEQREALLEVALEGEYWRPTCPSCGIKLVQRKRKKAATPSGAAATIQIAATRSP